MTQVAWTPDGSMVATSDKDGYTYLWDPANGRLIHRFSVPGAGKAFATAISPDGSTLAAGYSNGSTYLWNIASGTLTATLPDPGPTPATQVNSVAFSPDGRRLVSADNNGNAYVWRVGLANPNSTPIRRLPDPAGQGVLSVAFSSDGTLATGDYGGHVYLWEVGSGSQINSFSDSDGLSVTALAFSPGGSVLAAGSGSGSGSHGGLYLFSSSGQPRQDIMSPGAVWALSFNGSTLAAADDDGQTYLFTVHEGSTSAISGQTLADPNPGSQGVGAMAFSPNGKLLVTGDTSGNGQAYVWSSG
jgi:WD40 repeat protein